MLYLLIGIAVGFTICWLLHSSYRQWVKRQQWLDLPPPFSAWKDPDWL